MYFSAIIATGLFFILSNTNALAQDNGEAVFKQTCAACHSIGRGRLVGPDLANIHQRRPEDWIISFVKSSQTVIKSGDKYADSLFTAYNKTPMPDHPNITDVQMKDLLTYIETKSTVSSTATTGTNTVATTQQAKRPSDSLFSTINIFLLSAIVIMLLVIISLARINKNLLDQIKDFYSSDRSYFKKTK